MTANSKKKNVECEFQRWTRKLIGTLDSIL